MSRRIFQPGTAIRVEAEVKDSDGTLMDPDTSIKITITNPSGTAEITSQDMTKDETGVYYYIWQSNTDDPVGTYTVKVVAVDGSYTGIVAPRLFEIT